MNLKSRLFPLPALLIVFAFACGANEQESTNTATGTDQPLIPVSTVLTSDASTATPALDSTVAPASATTPGSPGGAALVPSATGGATVIVTLAENSLAVPTESVPRGPVVFTVSNTGKVEHNLRITGTGVEQQLPSILQAGQANSITVNLAPGTYQLVCPVSDHATNERATLTVAP